MGSKKDSSTAIGGPFRLRSRSKRRTFTLKPKYGVMAPTIDFYEYNSKRSADDVRRVRVGVAVWEWQSESWKGGHGNV